MSLPPLPKPDAIGVWGGITPTRYTDAAMREYGQQCREAALEEAHAQCLYVSDATSEGHSALVSPSSAAEDCADRIMALRSLK